MKQFQTDSVLPLGSVSSLELNKSQTQKILPTQDKKSHQVFLSWVSAASIQIKVEKFFGDTIKQVRFAKPIALIFY